MTQYDIESTIKAIREEIKAQDIKWHEQNHPDGTGPYSYPLEGIVPTATNVTALYLEIKAKEKTDSKAQLGKCTFKDILLEEVFEALAAEDQDRLVEELIQSAAVIVQWIAKIGRDKSTEHFVNGEWVK